MTFEPNEDLSIFLTALERLAGRHDSGWTPANDRFLYSEPLTRDLEEGGFFDCAAEPSLGLLAATAMVRELARRTLCVEAAASALVRPLVCPDLPRPLAVVWSDPRRPARFLPFARAVLHVQEDRVMATRLKPGDVRAVDSAFAYPMGVLDAPETLQWEQRGGSDEVRRLVDLWRLGIAAEMTGCLQGGLDAVVAHVKERRQFGRPLGSFQAVQHRLASAASAIEGAHLLTMQAAWSGASIDAAMAAGHSQAIATRISYDLHQFMGAMGLTLEHPLHRWTYRTKLLRSDLGSAERQFQAVAGMAWPGGVEKDPLTRSPSLVG